MADNPERREQDADPRGGDRRVASDPDYRGPERRKGERRKAERREI